MSPLNFKEDILLKFVSNGPVFAPFSAFHFKRALRPRSIFPAASALSMLFALREELVLKEKFKKRLMKVFLGKREEENEIHVVCCSLLINASATRKECS